MTKRGADLRLMLYSAGNFGKNILWGSAEVTLLFMMTDMLGLAAGFAGLLLLSSLIIDGGLDLAVGVLAERSRTRLGQYGPFLIFGAPLCGLAFFLLFSLPAWQVRSVAVVAIAVIGFRGLFALIDLPHNALLAKVGTHSRQRARIAGYRFFFSSLASLCVAGLAPFLIGGETGTQAANALQVFGALAGLASAAVLITAWIAVRDSDRLPVRAPSAGMLRSFPTDPLFLHLGAIVLLTGLFAPLFVKSCIYYARYVLEDPAAAGQALAWLVAGQIVGVGLCHWAVQHWEKRFVLACCHGLTALAFLLASLSASHNAHALFLFGGLAGVGLAGVYILPWALAPDVIDLGEHRAGQRREATTFAGLIVLLKLAAGLGFAFVGWSLSAVGYEPNAEQTPAVRGWITLLTFLAPAGGSAVCVILALKLPVTHAEHAAALKELGR